MTQSFRSVWCSHGKLNMDDDYYSIDSILAENQVRDISIGSRVIVDDTETCNTEDTM